MDFQLAEAAGTEALGAALARAAPWSRPQSLTVFLEGDLGSGKTTLARGLLRALGVTGTVRSPSYTLLESYAPPGRQVLHLDLYRLNSAAELEGLGLRDALDPGVLLLVEWPERARAGLPLPDLEVGLSFSGEQRRAQLVSGSAAGAAWLAGLSADPLIQNKGELVALDR